MSIDYQQKILDKHDSKIDMIDANVNGMAVTLREFKVQFDNLSKSMELLCNSMEKLQDGQNKSIEKLQENQNKINLHEERLTHLELIINKHQHQIATFTNVLNFMKWLGTILIGTSAVLAWGIDWMYRLWYIH